MRRVGLAPLSMFKYPVFFSRKFQGGVSFVDPFSDLCFKTNLYVHHMLGKGCPLGAFLSDVSL